MSLLGTAAVAIWHDIALEGRSEFFDWHGKEHMPERVGIPGFLRGRRYVASDAESEFFNLYEAESPEVLTGPDYLGRLNAPSVWTRSVVQHFRDVSRSICRVAATFGAGQGGLAATWRYDVTDHEAVRHVEAMSTQILPGMIENGSIAGAHLLATDTHASSVDNAEERARTKRNRIPNWIVIVEGWGDSDDFASICRKALPNEVLASAGATGPADFGLYQLQATIDRSELGANADG